MHAATMLAEAISNRWHEARRMRAVAIGTSLLIGALSCGEGKSDTDRDALTQRQRDSVVGASRLPGAQGVRGALKASDSATARRAREDSTDQEP